MVCHKRKLKIQQEKKLLFLLKKMERGDYDRTKSASEDEWTAGEEFSDEEDCFEGECSDGDDYFEEDSDFWEDDENSVFLDNSEEENDEKEECNMPESMKEDLEERFSKEPWKWQNRGFDVPYKHFDQLSGHSQA